MVVTTEYTVKMFLQLWLPVIMISLMFINASEGVEWGYANSDLGPEEWQEEFPACGGSAQSPVDINTNVLEESDELGSLSLVGWDEPADSLTLTNTGHSAQVNVEGNFTIEGGELPGIFKVAQFHFHVGKNRQRGSEHTIDSRAFPAEMHIVTWNIAYGSIGEAQDKPDGLAVLGIMLKVGKYKNKGNKKAFNSLAEKLPEINEPESSTSIDPNSFTLSDLLPSKLFPLYRYQGSLTTPGCFESVTWTVLAKPVKVPSRILKALRSIHDDHGYPIVDNFRPVQPLNGRIIKTG